MWRPSENLVTNLNVLQSIDDWFREPVFLPSCYDAPNNTRIHLQLLLGDGPGDLKIFQEALIQNRLHTRKGNESHPVDPWNFPPKLKKKPIICLVAITDDQLIHTYTHTLISHLFLHLHWPPLRTETPVDFQIVNSHQKLLKKSETSLVVQWLQIYLAM